jgi:hypothetical protein
MRGNLNRDIVRGTRAHGPHARRHPNQRSNNYLHALVLTQLNEYDSRDGGTMTLFKRDIKIGLALLAVAAVLGA